MCDACAPDNHDSLNLMLDSKESFTVRNINTPGRTAWCKISVAADSGACAHVAPANVFALAIDPTEKSKAGHNYFGAGGDPLKNLGSQRVSARDASGQLLTLEFDIVDKVTKPLASVHSIAKKGNAVVFEDDGGYVLHKASGKKTPLRLEGKLYYLDLWVQVPEELAKASPFCRPAGAQ